MYSFFLLNLLLLLMVEPSVGFLPVLAFDINIETLAVGLSLTVLQSLSAASVSGRRPILVRVARRGVIMDTKSRHVVTTTRHNQTEVVIALWAGVSFSNVPYRYRHPGDVLLGFVRAAVPAAPRGIAQVVVTVSVLFEWCGRFRGGEGPPAYRERLLVTTEIEGNDTRQPKVWDVILRQEPADRFITCWPRGRGWDPRDLEVHKSLADSKIEDDDIDAQKGSKDVVLELPQPVDDAAHHAVNSSEDGGALIEPDCHHYEIARSMNACFHVSGPLK